MRNRAMRASRTLKRLMISTPTPSAAIAKSADGQRARRTRADGDRRRTAGRGGEMGWSWEEDSAACGAMAKQKFGSTHTDIKLAKLAAYLGAFNTALKNQPFERLYIDAFAGTGEIETAESDLPLIDGAEVDAL